MLARWIRPGDRITLTAESSTLAYSVTAVDTSLKARLPYERIFGQSSAPRVVLVTCGGEYDRAGGGWDSNVIITFEPV